ncbi:protein rolling stone-like isoform X1 [Vanessa tameamea]|uniref:Protein rolling stone-like isoform X1 n=2 Tax=Vanessa TaxID=42274 RepID=A0A8B8IPW5_VANTA|nr:protein rolling stone-like isoform X1 [Vanessa tameamea]XP_047530070.1 protein rolling stone-like isoform X1 [Vanessa atalanta]
MCKHFVLVPLETSESAMKKTCKPAMLSRIWQASRRALNLEHSPPQVFACSQWQNGSHPVTSYFVYRWLLFLTVLSIGISSFACQRLPRLYKGPKVELNYFKWFIYFTNWGYLLIVVQAGLALAVVHRYKSQRSFNIPCEDEEIPMPRRQRTPLLCRSYWLAHTVATDLAFVITLIYWTLVHDPKIHEINTLNLLVHGGNSLVMLLELAVTAHPVRAAHALFGAGAGLAYGVFSGFYWAVGGTDRIGLPAIYPALDWNKPASALGFVALCAAVMMFAHGVATCLAYARSRLAARLLPARARADRLTLPTH